jgi:hypothetical protein
MVLPQPQRAPACRAPAVLLVFDVLQHLHPLLAAGLRLVCDLYGYPLLSDGHCRVRCIGYWRSRNSYPTEVVHQLWDTMHDHRDCPLPVLRQTQRVLAFCVPGVCSWQHRRDVTLRSHKVRPFFVGSQRA